MSSQARIEELELLTKRLKVGVVLTSSSDWCLDVGARRGGLRRQLDVDVGMEKFPFDAVGGVAVVDGGEVVGSGEDVATDVTIVVDGNGR